MSMIHKYLLGVFMLGFLLVPVQSIGETCGINDDADVCFRIQFCAKTFLNDETLNPGAPRTAVLAGTTRLMNVDGIPGLEGGEDEVVAIGTFRATYIGLGPEETVIDIGENGIVGPLLCISGDNPAPSWCDEVIEDLDSHFHFIKDRFVFYTPGNLSDTEVCAEDDATCIGSWFWQAPEIGQVLNDNEGGARFPLPVLDSSKAFDDFLVARVGQWSGRDPDDIDCLTDPGDPYSTGIAQLLIDFEVRTKPSK